MPDLTAQLALQRRTAAWWNPRDWGKGTPDDGSTPALLPPPDRPYEPGFREPPPRMPPDLVGPDNTVTHGWQVNLTSKVFGVHAPGGTHPVTRGKGPRRRPDDTGPATYATLWPQHNDARLVAPWLPDGTEVRVLGQGRGRYPENAAHAATDRGDLSNVTIVELIDPDLPDELIGTRWGLRPDDLQESLPFDERRRPASRQAAMIAIEDSEAGLPLAQLEVGDVVRFLVDVEGVHEGARGEVVAIDASAPILIVRAPGLQQDPLSGAIQTGEVEVRAPLDALAVVLNPADDRAP